MWLIGSLIPLLEGRRSPKSPPREIESHNGHGPASPAPPAPPLPEKQLTPLEQKATGDPDVTCAFATGWQMTELFQCALRIKTCGSDVGGAALPGKDGLACLRELDASDRAHLALDEVGVALFKLRGRFAEAAVEPPTADDLPAILDAARKGDDTLMKAVSAKHDDLLRRLGAADFRIGKSYRLGVQLAQAVLGPEERADLDHAFGARAVAVRTSLADLASAFPPHASRAVSISVRTWELWASDPELEGEPVTQANWAGVRSALRRQGKLWRSLLSGEKCGEDMLSTPDYVKAANGLVGKASRMALSFTRGLIAVVMFAIVAGALLAFVASDDSLRAIGGPIVALAGSIGLTGIGLRTRASRFAKHLEEHLWVAEMDEAVAAAITIGPHGWGVDVSDVNIPAAGARAAAAPQLATIASFREALKEGKRRKLEPLLGPRIRIAVDGLSTDDPAGVVRWMKGLSDEQREAFGPHGEPVVAGYPGYFVVDLPDGGADLWRVREGKITIWRRCEDRDEARAGAGLASVT